MSAIKETLQSGLAETFKAFPLLSGTVQVIKTGVQQGTLYVSDPWNNVSKVFHVRDLRVRGINYADLRNKNFPVQASDESVFTPLANINYQAPQKPVMLVQVNIIRGGFIVALCMHHSFTDANGTVAVARIWAAYCRRENGSRLITRDMVDRERLMQWGEGERASAGELTQVFFLPSQAQSQSTPFSGGNISMAKDVPNFGHGILPTQAQTPNTALTGDNISKAKDIPSVGHGIQSNIFFFSRIKLAELKSMASKERDENENGNGWISTNDALCSLFGCCVHSANTLDAEEDDKQAVIGVAVNMRPFLDPPLPSDSIGNVLNRLRITVPRKTLKPTAKRVTEIAHQIRQKIKLLDQASYCRTISFLKSLPDISRADILVPESQDVIGFSSWSKLNFYDIDWGNVVGTKIERVRSCITAGFKDFAIFLPELKTPRFETDQCGLEVLIWLEESKMTRLKQDQLFNRFAKCQC